MNIAYMGWEWISKMFRSRFIKSLGRHMHACNSFSGLFLHKSTCLRQQKIRIYVSIIVSLSSTVHRVYVQTWRFWRRFSSWCVSYKLLHNKILEVTRNTSRMSHDFNNTKARCFPPRTSDTRPRCRRTCSIPCDKLTEFGRRLFNSTMLESSNQHILNHGK
jgi:hypothetical protein